MATATTGSPLLPSRATFSRNVQASDSRSTGESGSVSTGLNSSTAWGMTTSMATGDSESLALAMQRSREFLVEQHELQQLPASAMIITYAAPAGRQVVMADANPGIAGLSMATSLTLEEFRDRPGEIAASALRRTPRDPRRNRAIMTMIRCAPLSWRSGDTRPSPNLGPPPPRLDWRKRRS